jgi:hypothetical protein
VLILKSVSLGPLHGYAILARIEQITQGALLVEQGGAGGAGGRLSARPPRRARKFSCVEERIGNPATGANQQFRAARYRRELSAISVRSAAPPAPP